MDGPEDMAGRYGAELFDVLNGNAVEDGTRYWASDQVLDLGANDTVSIPYMTDADVVQLDIDPHALHDGKDRAASLEEKGYDIKADRVAADAAELPLEEDSFDTIVACASFYNGRTDGAILGYSDVPAVLEERGRLVLGSGRFRDQDIEDSIRTSALAPIADRFDEVYAAGERVLVFDGYHDPEVSTDHEIITGDELEDRLRAWDGEVRSQDPFGQDQEHDSGTDLETWIRSDLHILDEQYPSAETGTPALATIGETEWYEATVDGDEYALARASVNGPGGPLAECAFQLGPAEQDNEDGQ